MRHLPVGLLLLLSTLSNADYTWPSPKLEQLESFLYEGGRSDGSNLASLVHPCRKRIGTLANVGAEWLRMAFHDMATHNVDDGTGGMDGSIVYELGRPENFSPGLNQTANDFENFPNKMVSRADVIAVAAVHAVASCGGPIIPYRGGRIDTYQAGGGGTPEPQHDLDTLKESFRKQGFSQSEMIKLVACGHSMGGVRSTDFPQLVPPNEGSTATVIKDFDTTMQFDNKVVTEYLDGTTQNVLVVTSNKTMASDIRVFEADNNSTMQSLASPDAFQSECRDILARMLDTVPKGVTLTDEITLLHAKVKGVQLSIEKDKLVFKSTLRLTQAMNSTENKNRVVTMFWCDRYGDNKDCKGATRSSIPVNKASADPNISPVTLRLGYYFINYDFVVPINSAQSISKFWFEVDEKDGSKATVYNNGGNDYVVSQDQVFFVPMLSTVDVISNGTYTKTYTNRDGESFYRVYHLVTAVRNDASPSRVYVDGFDSSVLGFGYAVNHSVDLTLNSTFPPIEGYKFYTGIFESSGLQLTLDVHADKSTQEFVETTALDSTPYYAPGTVNTVGSKSSDAISWNADGWFRFALSALLFVFSYHLFV